MTCHRKSVTARELTSQDSCKSWKTGDGISLPETSTGGRMSPPNPGVRVKFLTKFLLRPRSCSLPTRHSGESRNPVKQRVALRATQYLTGCRVKSGMTDQWVKPGMTKNPGVRVKFLAKFLLRPRSSAEILLRPQVSTTPCSSSASPAPAPPCSTRCCGDILALK